MEKYKEPCPEALVESALNNIKLLEDENCIIYCDSNKITNVIKIISKLSIKPISISLTWISNNKVSVNKKDGEKLFNLINQLEDNDDVQNISSNYDISKEVFDTIDF